MDERNPTGMNGRDRERKMFDGYESSNSGVARPKFTCEHR
jgi:hypothetical protein